jgi:hypothetical protein
MLQLTAKPLEEIFVGSVWFKVGNGLLHGDIVSITRSERRTSQDKPE